MAPRVEPILLWGFCFATQQQQHFNQSWACAWLTSWYTDEHHPLWDSVDDASKRREIRYGNNIAVLFRTLLACKRFWGQDSLWAAVARGFNTSPTIVRVTADILTNARRAQRSKPAREVSETARAADDWIDFLDSVGPYQRVLSDPEVYKVADAFLKSQEKKLVNAARVPLGPANPRYSLHLNTRALTEEKKSPSPRLPPTPSAKPEPPGDASEKNPLLLRATARKRSASPLPCERSSKSSRPDPPLRLPPQPGSATQQQQQQQPRNQPPSPRRAGNAHLALPAKPVPPEPRLSAQTARNERENGTTASTLSAADETAALRARIASLEKELAAAQSKLAAPATQKPRPVGEVLSGLQKDMATVTNAVETMMDSMHVIVDNLSLLQGEVSALTGQQKTLAAALPDNNSTSRLEAALLQPVQAVADSVHSLREELRQLKADVHAAQPQPQPPPQQQANNTPCPPDIVESLLREQTARIDKLAREVAGLQQHMGQRQPQNLRQAMAAAERDLRHHLASVARFYHQLDGAAGRGTAERTADFLAALEDSLRSAQLGQRLGVDGPV